MKKNWIEPVIVGIFLIFSLFLMFHTFGLNGVQKNILIARTLWSDFGSHIPLIRSFSMGNNWPFGFAQGKPPEYPIFPGEPIRYHFLFYMLVGYLEKIGLPLDWALNLPSALGFALLLWGIWSLAIALFKNKAIAFLSVLFFLFNGSLSFINFFSRRPLTLASFPAFGPWDGGVISAFWNLNIYTNQRHLALAFAIGIWFILWVIRKAESLSTINSKHQALNSKQYQNPNVQSSKRFGFEIWKLRFVWDLGFRIWNLRESFLWGIILGVLPYFHQPTLVIMGILMGSSFLFYPRLRLPLLISTSIGLLFIAPQLLTMPKTASLSWFPGYLAHEHLSILTFLNFWVQNVGLHAFLIPLGFFLIPKHTRHILFPLVLLFAIGNLFKFSMEVAANHKFFNFALILGNMVSAYVIIFLISRIKPFIGRIGVLVGLVGLLTLSGFIDFFVILNDTKGALPDVGNNQTATWIANNTPKDAIFLNSSFLYHPASLAGRKIFLGWPYFAWSAGYDTYKRNDEMRLMYESKDPKVFCPLLTKHGISYITVEDTKNDPNLPRIDTKYFESLAKPVFTDTKHATWIYTTTDLCAHKKRTLNGR